MLAARKLARYRNFLFRRNSTGHPRSWRALFSRSYARLD